ncbi:hypothetical protein K440DRAFT_606725 [Wilcoxina mikolae CBS 423.85]|nr:hypothetical protein K440DRAFT_606725 [Wilcoxina mikolae CBS 423.85]
MMDVAGAAGLAFGVIGAVDVCLKYGKSILETYKSYQDAHREISELILRINHQWFKISTNLEFLRTTFQDLKPELQVHIGNIVRTLKFKLQQASDGIAAVVSAKGVVRKVKYAMLFKKEIEDTVRQLEEWQGMLDPGFFLIARCKGGRVDTQLQLRETEEEEGGQVQAMKRLRQALRGLPEARGGRTISLRAEDFGGQKIPVYYSTAAVTLDSQSRRNVIITTVTSGPRSDLEQFQKDVYELVQILSRADPMTFGILACKGVIQQTLPSPRPRTEFELVFDFPGDLSAPKSLRELLNASTATGDVNPTHSLEEHFHLSKQLARSVMFVHSCMLVHKNIRPETILVFNGAETSLGKPFLVGFDRFRPIDGATFFVGDILWHRGLYHHPSRQGRFADEKYKMQHDIYSLGVCLLEIGLWSSFVVRQKEGNVAGPELNVEEFLAMKDIRKRAVEVKQTLVDMAVKKLPGRMGGRYTDVVVSCLTCLDKDNDAFGEEGELVDEDGVLIGVSYIEVVCTPRWNWVRG